jgi:hypothetical protein
MFRAVSLLTFFCLANLFAATVTVEAIFIDTDLLLVLLMEMARCVGMGKAAIGVRETPTFA